MSAGLREKLRAFGAAMAVFLFALQASLLYTAAICQNPVIYRAFLIKIFSFAKPAFQRFRRSFTVALGLYEYFSGRRLSFLSEFCFNIYLRFMIIKSKTSKFVIFDLHF
jgi:hypothetical protein